MTDHYSHHIRTGKNDKVTFVIRGGFCNIRGGGIGERLANAWVGTR